MEGFSFASTRSENERSGMLAPATDGGFQLSRAHVEQILSPRHHLVRLRDRSDWPWLQAGAIDLRPIAPSLEDVFVTLSRAESQRERA
jgi:hypothetical protein